MDKLKLNFEDQDGKPNQNPDLNPPSVVIPPTEIGRASCRERV